MKKIEIINQHINRIQECSLVKCILTDNLIYNDIDYRINLYLFINEEESNEVYKFVSNVIDSYNVLVHNINKYEDNVDISSFYFENNININIYYLYNFEYVIKNNIVPLYDPYNVTSNFKSKKFLLTNKEFADLIDSFCEYIYSAYNYYIQGDKLAAYSKSLNAQEDFILVYRGFYDSMNAKKGFVDCKSMNIKFLNNLMNIIKAFKYDAIIENIQIMINEVDKMINQLPVNIITLFNFDFYTFTRKLIFSL